MQPLPNRTGPRPRRGGVIASVAVVAVLVALVAVSTDRGSLRLVRATRSDAAVTTEVTDTTGATGTTSLPPDDTWPTIPPASIPPASIPVATLPVESIPVETMPVETLPPVVDDPDLALADPNLFVSLLPQLVGAPAPSWVRQGTRLTYDATAVSVPGSYHEYVEDEDGGWVDPATGDRYRQVDIPGAAGHGLNQVTVTSLTDSLAALSIRAFGFIDLDSSNPVTTLSWGGSVGLPGAGADYWLDVDVLAGVDEVVSSGVKVVRMPYLLDGTEYRSIWVQLIGDDGNFTWVYDLDSGVLLHTSSSTTGPPITGPVAEGEGRDGSTFLTQSTLVGVRDIDLPWADDAAPSWITSIDHFEYTGSVTVEVAGTPSAQLGADLTVDRIASTDDWARYRFARTLSTTVSPSVTEYVERIDGPAQVAAMFVPPDGLAALGVGQVLDDDPLTGATVSVAAIEPTDVDTYITIVEQGPAEQSELVYELSSGLLVSSTSTDLHLGTTIRLDLVSWS